MKLNLKEPWIVRLLSKISQIFMLMTLMGVSLFIVVSRQGLGKDLAYFILVLITIISFINMVFLIVNLVFNIISDKRVKVKVKSIIYSLFSLLVTVVVFLFVNSVYILSKGSLE